jgi:MerR family transcriptional regulator, redox-sensitive transcriptional activator SoxR
MGLEAGFKSSLGREMDWPELTIGEIARRAGVASSAIRYYERIGLLPEPMREHGQRRYDESVLGKLGFIGVAQSAGFSLDEIKQLMQGIDSGGMADPMRALSSRKLDEVEALLERTKAMKGWLQVAQECGCMSPEECSLFPSPEQQTIDPELTLTLVRVKDGVCRRESA